MSALTFKTLSTDVTQAFARQSGTPPTTTVRCTLGRSKVMVLVEYPQDSAKVELMAEQTLNWLEQYLRQHFDTTGLPEEAADLANAGEEVTVQLFLKHLHEGKPFTMRSFIWKVEDGFDDLFGLPQAQPSQKSYESAFATHTGNQPPQPIFRNPAEIDTVLPFDTSPRPSESAVAKLSEPAEASLSEPDENLVPAELQEDHLQLNLEPDLALDFDTELGLDGLPDAVPGSIPDPLSEPLSHQSQSMDVLLQNSDLEGELEGDINHDVETTGEPQSTTGIDSLLELSSSVEPPPKPLSADLELPGETFVAESASSEFELPSVELSQQEAADRDTSAEFFEIGEGSASTPHWTENTYLDLDSELAEGTETQPFPRYDVSGLTADDDMFGDAKQDIHPIEAVDELATDELATDEVESPTLLDLATSEAPELETTQSEIAQSEIAQSETAEEIIIEDLADPETIEPERAVEELVTEDVVEMLVPNGDVERLADTDTLIQSLAQEVSTDEALADEALTDEELTEVQEVSTDEDLTDNPLGIEDIATELSLIEELAVDNSSLDSSLQDSEEVLTIEELAVEDPLPSPSEMQAPVTEERVNEELTTEELTAEEPVLEDSTVEELTAEDSTVEELVLEDLAPEALSLESLALESPDSEELEAEALEAGASDAEASDAEALDAEASESGASEAEVLEAEVPDVTALEIEEPEAEALETEELEAEALGTENSHVGELEGSETSADNPLSVHDAELEALVSEDVINDSDPQVDELEDFLTFGQTTPKKTSPHPVATITSDELTLDDLAIDEPPVSRDDDNNSEEAEPDVDDPAAYEYEVEEYASEEYEDDPVYYLDEEEEEEEIPVEDVAAIDDGEVERQGEQWEQSSRGNRWIFAGTIGFFLVGALGFVLTQPCTVGGCDRIQTATTQGDNALDSLRTDTSLDAVNAAKQQLQRSIHLLDPIPVWSPHYRQAQEILPEYENQLTALDLVTESQAIAYRAAVNAQGSPHPVATWEGIAADWLAAAEALKSVPADSPVREFADRKLLEYRANRANTLVRIDAEKKSEEHLREAQKAASLGNTQAEAAESLEDWENALTSWETAVDNLSQIPQGTQAYDAARASLPEYIERLEEVRLRTEQERSASRELFKAKQLAADAQQAESEDQWTLSSENWKNALTQLTTVAEGTSAYIEAQSLRQLYASAQAQADNALQATLRFQPYEPQLFSACGSAIASKCTYSVRGGNVRLNLVQGYDNVIDQSITPPDQRSNVIPASQLVGQSNQLLRDITLLSTQAQVPVELYDAQGTFLARYRPDLNGFVR